jgi:hypothetical protein
LDKPLIVTIDQNLSALHEKVDGDFHYQGDQPNQRTGTERKPWPSPLPRFERVHNDYVSECRMN